MDDDEKTAWMFDTPVLVDAHCDAFEQHCTDKAFSIGFGADGARDGHLVLGAGVGATT